MRAVTVEPRVANAARLEEVPDPVPPPGWMLARTIALGVCGTDLEIVAGAFGEPPPGERRLVLGHESLGEVIEAPSGSGFAPGDWIAGVVRRPDPVPCGSCAAGEWDMCRNGRYTERGIKALHGYGSECFSVEPAFAVRVDRALGLTAVLTEPASVLAKAWEQVERIGARARWEPRRVLVTGAGPIGLLAALMGVERGLEVTVFDRVESGPKPALVRDLGATYRSGRLDELEPTFDVVLECTGVGALVQAAILKTTPDGVVCLTGLSADTPFPVDLAALGKRVVLDNKVVFGSVNANRRHYAAAVAALVRADRRWLERLISREVPLDRWAEALARQPDDVKPVIVFHR
jgi:glucose 1-dehydrogenase